MEMERSRATSKELTTGVMMAKEEDDNKEAHLSSSGMAVMECSGKTGHVFSVFKNIGQKTLNDLGEEAVLGASTALDHEGTEVGPSSMIFQTGPMKISGSGVLGGDGPSKVQEFSDGLPMELFNQGDAQFGPNEKKGNLRTEVHAAAVSNRAQW